MTDEEQRQHDADRQIEVAIQECVEAYGLVPDGAVVTNWLVLGAGLAMDDLGDIQANFKILPSSSPNWNTVFGLLHTARLDLERDYKNGDT